MYLNINMITMRNRPSSIRKKVARFKNILPGERKFKYAAVIVNKPVARNNKKSDCVIVVSFLRQKRLKRYRLYSYEQIACLDDHLL